MVNHKSWSNAKVESKDGDLPGLTKNFNSFLDTTYNNLFYTAMCYLWLEKQILFNGQSRKRRFRNSQAHDMFYSRFMKEMVGRDQTLLTRSRWFQVASAVSWEICPEFFLHNPFNEPQYYQWPLKHAGIDFLNFVYQIDNRMELLQYADDMKMSYKDFINWIANYVLCYNDSKGETIYNIGANREGTKHVQKVGWSGASQDQKLEDLKKHESEKT